MVHKTRRPYAILTTNSNRVEVNAVNLADAYRKAKVKLQEFKKSKNIMTKPDEDLTSAYETYGRTGVSKEGFIITSKSVELHKKHNLGGSSKTPLEVLYGKVV